MNVRVKLFYLIGVAVGAIAALAGVLYWASLAMRDARENFDWAHESVGALLRVTQELHPYVRESYDSVFFGEGGTALDKRRRSVEAAFAAMERVIRSGRDEARKGEEFARLERLRALFAVIDSAVVSARERRKAGERFTLDEEFKRLIEERFEGGFQPEIEQALEEENAEAERAGQQVRASESRLRALVILVSLVSVLVIMAAGSVLARSISLRLERLRHAAARLAKGDLEATATLAGNDEIAELGSAFDSMAASLRELIGSERERQLRESRKRTAELATANEELLRTKDDALEASRLKSEFLANMSHEIRTPLNVILGYASLVSDHLRDLGDRSQDPQLEGIERASRRLLDTIHKVLDLSKIETGTFELDRRRLPLAPLVERVVRGFEQTARTEGLALSCSAEEPEATVLFDEYCLSQALANLLENAVKFTNIGQVSTRLYRDADGVLCIDVHDTGVGIASWYLERLFRPFSQEDSETTRRYEGVGLGLCLVKKYVELNGAEIGVQSKKGIGSVFTIRFRQCEVGGTGPAGEDSSRALERAPSADRGARE